jgi:hypothetical protein
MATKKINIKNYSSEVSASNSISMLENVLIKAGCEEIKKIYKDKMASGIFFVLPVANMKLTFNMEAKTDRVYEKMIATYTNYPNATQRAATLKQAERCAWKNLFELVQLQLDMISLDQVEVMQVLLPYLTDGSQTFYEKIKENNFKLLLNS